MPETLTVMLSRPHLDEGGSTRRRVCQIGMVQPVPMTGVHPRPTIGPNPRLPTLPLLLGTGTMLEDRVLRLLPPPTSGMRNLPVDPMSQARAGTEVKLPLPLALPSLNPPESLPLVTTTLPTMSSMRINGFSACQRQGTYPHTTDSSWLSG